jgi:hypothetical protein
MCPVFNTQKTLNQTLNFFVSFCVKSVFFLAILNGEMLYNLSIFISPSLNNNKVHLFDAFVEFQRLPLSNT